MEGQCLEHSGHTSRLSTLEDAMKRNELNIDSAHRRVDGVKNWVIAGMASVLIQLLIAVYGLLKAAKGG